VNKDHACGGKMNTVIIVCFILTYILSCVRTSFYFPYPLRVLFVVQSRFKPSSPTLFMLNLI
jgi:hypothetical protein